MKKVFHKQTKNLFKEIDTKLLYGIQCSGRSQIMQTYLENLKVQTESAFGNKKFINF